MRRAVVLTFLLVACKSTTVDPELAKRADVDTSAELPPNVLMGKVHLDCRIDWKENGSQVLTLVDGSGLTFAASVRPIVDGTMTLKGETKGGEYRFSSPR